MTKAKPRPVGRKRTTKKIAEPAPVKVAAVEPVAQGDGDPAPHDVDAKIGALREELLAKIAPPVSEPEPFTFDERGCIAPKGYRELFTRVGNDRYEHTSETDDGRWIYTKS